jgi:hypothetical protein
MIVMSPSPMYGTLRDGLEENAYLWGLAADPADLDTLVASAAVGLIHANNYHM